MAVPKMLIDKTLYDDESRLPELLANDGSVVLIDKEQDWTSFDVVAKLRGILKIKKIGHAGTLDPLATGLLIVCTGKLTKSVNSFQDMGKTYTGEIKFGATTITDDSEAEEELIKEVNVEITEIENSIQQFVGKITQIPPKYSARKINGRRQYELARKNIEFEARPTEVEVYSFEITDWVSPVLSFKIKCSKGTYIMSLARDLGAVLGCGGYLKSLRRTAIGEYFADDAFKINELAELIKKSKNECI